MPSPPSKQQRSAHVRAVSDTRELHANATGTQGIRRDGRTDVPGGQHQLPETGVHPSSFVHSFDIQARELTWLSCSLAPCKIVLSGASEAIDKAIEIARRDHKRIKLVQKARQRSPPYLLVWALRHPSHGACGDCCFRWRAAERQRAVSLRDDASCGSEAAAIHVGLGQQGNLCPPLQRCCCTSLTRALSRHPRCTTRSHRSSSPTPRCPSCPTSRRGP
jgi:hypothetical protein